MIPDRATRVAPLGVEPSRWQADLDLQLARRGERVVLARAQHRGPLRVQRAFHPEGPDLPHVYVLHPPGGVVSTDELRVRVAVEPDARGLVTSPGATKLYRSRGTTARIEQHLTVAAGGALEWLPHEIIAFDGARAALSTRVELTADAAYCGWEIVCLGRPACGERFESGELSLALSVMRDGLPCFAERSRYLGGSETLSGGFGLGGNPAVGVFVAAPAGDAMLHAARDALGSLPHSHAAVTRIGEVLVGRFSGGQARHAHSCFEALRRACRPFYLGRPAVAPRIWAT